MPRYVSDPALPIHYDPGNPNSGHSDPDRRFTLRNLFQEIQYAGELKLDLDVTSTPGFNPTLTLANPYSAATGVAGTLTANVTDQGHRLLTLYSSIDLDRLVPSPPFGITEAAFLKEAAYDPARSGKEPPLATFAPLVKGKAVGREPSQECGQGQEIDGDLDLRSDMQAYFVHSDMNDIAVFPTNQLAKKGFGDAGLGYLSDRFTIVKEFTLTKSISGGAFWTLQYAKFGSGNTGLLNYQRTRKNTLTLTLIPLCIRQKYKGTKAHFRSGGEFWQYKPEPVEGTPRWISFLSPCADISQQGQINSIAAAHQENTIESLRLLSPQ